MTATESVLVCMRSRMQTLRAPNPNPSTLANPADYVSKADPGHAYTTAMSRVWGLLGLRLASSPLPAADPVSTAAAVMRWITQTQKLADDDSRAPAGLLDGLRAAADAFGAVAAKVALEAAAAADAATSAGDEAPAPLPKKLAALGDRLAFAERRFLHPAGLPGPAGRPLRKFYRHVLQAPDLARGYAASTLPGVTEAIRQGDWDLAAEQAAIVSERLRAAAAFLLHGTPEREPGPPGSLAALAAAGVVLALAMGALAWFAALGARSPPAAGSGTNVGAPEGGRSGSSSSREDWLPPSAMSVPSGQ